MGTIRANIVEGYRRRVVNMLDGGDLRVMCEARGFKTNVHGVSAMRRFMLEGWDEQTTLLVLDLFERNLDMTYESEHRRGGVA
jgi:hypothetical protein